MYVCLIGLLVFKYSNTEGNLVIVGTLSTILIQAILAILEMSLKA